MKEIVQLTFRGGLADQGELDFYDAAMAYEGFARFLLLTGHFCSTGKVIHKAPFSDARVTISAPEKGSFVLTAGIALGAAVFGAAAGPIFTRLFDHFLPPHNNQTEETNRLLKEQNRLKRIELGIEPKSWAYIDETEAKLHQYRAEVEALRGITGTALKKTFHPVGRSAETGSINVGELSDPIRVVDKNMADKINADRLDDHLIVTTGVVNNYSHSTQRGFLWDDSEGRRIRFEYEGRDLPAGNNLSWSLHEQSPLELSGRYVRWLDGNVKKILIRSTKRISKDDRLEVE